VNLAAVLLACHNRWAHRSTSAWAVAAAELELLAICSVTGRSTLSEQGQLVQIRIK
jgi:hypothetical protein